MTGCLHCIGHAIGRELTDATAPPVEADASLNQFYIQCLPA